MKLPFLWISFGFVGGILITLNLEPAHFMGPRILLIISAVVLWFLTGKRFFLPVLIFAFLMLGILRTQSQTEIPENSVQNTVSPVKQYLTGTVITSPEIKQRGKKQTLSFVLAAESAGYYPEIKTASGKVQVFINQPEIIPEAGDRVKLWGLLSVPPPVVNPGEFDYGKYLKQKNIHALFRGRGRAGLQLLLPSRFTLHPSRSIMRIVENFRSTMETKINQLYGERSGILNAIMIGKRGRVDVDTKSAFIKTGTAHLLAISGLHISLVAGTVFTLLLAFGFSRPVAACIGMATVTAYVLVSGSAIPVTRAGLMAVCVFLAVCLDRPHQFMNIFFLAFFLLLWSQPANLTDVSFQLSFLSVFSLIFFIPGALEHWKWKEIVGRHLAIMIGTMPVILYYFNIVSPVSIISNLAAIPLFHIALLSGFLSLTDLPLLADLFGLVCRLSLEAALIWIRFTAALPFSYFYRNAPDFYELIVYFGSALFLWGFRAKTGQFWNISRSITSFFWMGAALLILFAPGNSRAFEVTVFSAGQNEAAYIRLNNEHWLVNTGRQYPSNQGEWMILPFLRHRGINKLKGVILTDDYKKHSGGLTAIQKDIKVDRIITPRKICSQKAETVLSERKNYRLTAYCRGGKEVILQAEFNRWKILFLPSADPEMSEWIRDNPDKLRDVQVLVLPAISRGREDEAVMNFYGIFDLIDPEVVIAQSESEILREFFQTRDIPVYATKTAGAITMSAERNAKIANMLDKKASILVADSVLEGRLRMFHDVAY